MHETFVIQTGHHGDQSTQGSADNSASVECNMSIVSHMRDLTLELHSTCN
jgi:hypothetical protein